MGLLLIMSNFTLRGQQPSDRLKGSASKGGTSREPTVFVLQAETQHVDLGKGIEYYEDTGSGLTLTDICSTRSTVQWKVFEKAQTLSFGFKRSAYWLRFAVQNAAPAHNDILLGIAFPALDSIEVFELSTDGVYKRFVMGDYLPFSRREVKYRTFVKRFDLPDSQPRLYYLRIKTTSSMIVPLTLYRSDTFFGQSFTSQLFFGWTLGVLMILVLYHLVLFLFTREKSYLNYIVYMVGVILYVVAFNGFAAQYLFPESGHWLQYTTLVSVATSALGLVLFTQSFLHLREKSPRLNLVMRGLAMIIVVLIASSVIVDYLTVNILLTSLLLPTAAICYGVSWYVIRRLGMGQYQYFLVGSLSLIIGGVLASLMVAGVLPNTIITRNSVQIGAITESLLFSLALSQRYKVLQDEKVRAQQENLRLHQEANATLQRAVRERTAELNDKNLSLEAANEEIQRQMEVQTEQAREIELANTMLQEQNEMLQSLNIDKNEIMGIVTIGASKKSGHRPS